jgi:hypothetical protein
VGLVQLPADDRELLERRMQQRFLRVGVAMKDESQDGHEQQQQREDREERKVGDQRRVAARLIV